MAQSAVALTKTKKRVWMPIQAPSIFGKRQLGETLVEEPEQAVGRTVIANLMTLTDDIKKQNMNVHLRVDRVEKGEAHSRVIGYELVPASIKRNVRRGRNRIDISFPISTKDGKTMRIKGMFITSNIAHRSTLTSIRHHAIGWMGKYISEMTYDEVVNDLISQKLQRTLKNNLKTIYPLKACEIRVMKLESEDPTLIVKPMVVVEKQLDLEKKPAKRKRKEATAEDEQIPIPTEEE